MTKIDLLFRFITEQIKGYRKNRSNSIRFKNYYLSVKDDKRNTFAKVFDYSMWRIFIFFVTFIVILLKTNRLYLSVIVSSIIFLISHLIAIRARNYKLEYMKKQKRRYVASQRIYNEIMNKTTDEIKEYTKEIFSPIGLTNFEFVESNQKHILLKSMYKEEEIMLLFNIYKNNLDVELKEVKEFIYLLTKNKLKKGIIITTSDFTSDSYNFVSNLNKNYGLLLINKEQLLKIIENNGLFPNDKEIDEIIESKISRSEKKWDKYRRAALSKEKVRKYIILSICLIIAAWYTPYTMYYIVVASFILALAFITFISNIIKKDREIEERRVDFEKLLNDL